MKRPEPGTIPDAPGSYQFKDRDGRVVYVGKAKSLRSRLANYFADPRTLHPRTAQMVATAETVEWVQVRNEVEALMLEYSLIKAHRPRFNVRLKDDKSYPYLVVTTADEWPRAGVRRGPKDKSSRWFGPYGHAYAIRETLDLLLRTFPVRTCSDHKFRTHERQGRPCLLFHIEKCAAPCVRQVDKLGYDALVRELVEFLEGDTDAVVKRLGAEMAEAAADLEYERAARLRDRLASVRKAVEKQQMVAERDEDLDVVGIAEDELEASVQVFLVRRGRVTGRRGFVMDKVEALDRPRLVAAVLEQLYASEYLGEAAVVEGTGSWRSTAAADLPKEVLVPDLPDDASFYEEWLALLKGQKVAVRAPQRGDRRALLETVTKNAAEELARSRLKRSADYNSRARALSELQDALGLPEAPLRIECYDMSHVQGTDYVGSMVVLEDGLPKKSEYRRFKVRTVGGNDDYAAMEEVLTRRLRALLAEREAGPDGRPRKFSYPPQLLLVDGGKGQLAVAVRVLEALGLDEEIPAASLAKQFEEVYLPGEADPVRIPRTSEALYLLQRVRDEAHRFAITYHRELRGKRMTKSVLDEVPGLGPARKKRLVAELGGVTAVRKASLEALEALPWLPDAVARAVYDKTHPAAPADRRPRVPVPTADA